MGDCGLKGNLARTGLAWPQKVAPPPPAGSILVGQGDRGFDGVFEAGEGDGVHLAVGVGVEAVSQGFGGLVGAYLRPGSPEFRRLDRWNWPGSG